MRIVQIGCGGFGSLYARALRDERVLAGIAVRREVTVERVRAEHGVPVSTDAAALLDEVKPDGVQVLSPTEWHSTHVRLALERSLPAVVIKPAAVHPDTVRVLRAEAEGRKVPVLMGHEGVFAPAYVALEKAITAGDIGAVRSIRWLNAGARQLSGGREQRAPEAGDEVGRNLGHIYATAMHELLVANRLAGRIAPQSAEVARVFASSVAAQLDARLRYANGIEAIIRYDFHPDRPFRRGLHVVGDGGSVLWLMETGKTTLQLQRGRTKRDLPFHGGAAKVPAQHVVRAFIAVLEGAPPDETLEDGCNALLASRLLTEAAAERLGMAVDVDMLAGGRDR